MKGAELDEIEAVYREGFAAFARTATAIAGDAESGRDAVQEAFAKAVRERDAFRREGTLEAWLWPIVINEARDRARRGGSVALTGEPTSDGYGSENDALRTALAALPERQRLGLSSGTTRISTTRALLPCSPSRRARLARHSTRRTPRCEAA
jgi:DNA-directed RNA polymerase specialized sigma24 family protein